MNRSAVIDESDTDYERLRTAIERHRAIKVDYFREDVLDAELYAALKEG